MKKLRKIFVAVLALLCAPSLVCAETPGKDGDLTVSTAVTVNQYAALSGSVVATNTSITVVSLSVNLPSLQPGDLIMIYQAQGAEITTTDSIAYGEVSKLNNAGRWEYQTVGSISGNTINLAGYGGQCGGLRYSYDAAGKPQVLRVPQYRNLTITASGSINAAAWDGTKGGVVSVHVSGTLANAGAISADAAGFRGGVVNINTGANYNITGYRTTDANQAGTKGESIAGFQTEYDSLGGRYGRGAPANGGGGGNAHNGGGGGGANGNNGQTWAGQGVPSLTTAGWASAWNLDGTLTSTTNNSGGGRGGYTYGSSDQNALTLAPGSAAWGGDSRRQLGGLGGRPLTFIAQQNAFLGGGGGSGDANNNAASGGGRGGGFVVILANTMSGSGQVRANGATAPNTSGGHNDSPGGGGGGGTIITRAASTGSVTFQANGGNGGSQLITSAESEGPGGGGGGGVVAVSVTPTSSTANAGANGITSSSAVTEFTPNGATRGAVGQPSATAPTLAQLPFCFVPNLPLTMIKSSSMATTVGDNRFAIPGSELFYDISVTNPAGPVDNGTLVIIDPLPASIDFFNGDIDTVTAGIQNVVFIDGATSSALTCCLSAQVAYSLSTTGTDFTYVPTAGYDPLVRRVRITLTGSMAAALNGATSFSIRFRARIK